MRFIRAAATGLALTAATAGFVALGAWSLAEARSRGAGSGTGRAPVERVFAVLAGRFALGDATPTISAFGEVVAWRSLDIRPAVEGRIVALSPEFRDGARVEAGEILVRIDPADYDADVADAEFALASARAEAAEARQSIRSAELEVQAARTQAALRRATLERQRGLAARGVASQQAVDEAELALAAAEQAAAGRAQALLTAEMRAPRADLDVERAELAVAEARRTRAETEIRAPFSGLLDGAEATLGDFADSNATLGRLIDPTSLEAAFQVTNAEFARLIDDSGALLPLTVSVRLDLGERSVEANARLVREGATIAEGRTGRRLFAAIELGAATSLRAGDFVAVRVSEPRLRDVAVIPATAATEDGRVLLIGGDDRLREHSVDVLRRDGDNLVVSGAPPGAAYVAVRTPQLGPGVKVRPSFGAEVGPPAAAVPAAGAWRG